VVIYDSLTNSIDGRGKGINMLKDSSNRKRKYAEVEEVKGEELQLKQNKQQYLQ
jgi:hypothetical protein